MPLFVRCKSNKQIKKYVFFCLPLSLPSISDPRLQNCRLPNEAADTSSRLVNLDFTLRSIRSFVQVIILSASIAFVMLGIFLRMCFAISLLPNCLISI